MNVLNGLKELLQSPSGLFSLICLMVLTVLTWKIPSLGPSPWCAFFAIIPSALGYFEHKEALAQMNLPDKGTL